MPRSAAISALAPAALLAVALAAPFAIPAIAQAPAAGAAAPGVPALTAQDEAKLRAAIASPLRSAANRARDQYRNPFETLRFFGVRPSDTVVELVPAGGWYTEILAAYTHGNGNYVAAGEWERGLAGVRALKEASPQDYRSMLMTEFPARPNSGNPVVTPGTADVVLTFRNVHNMRFGGVDRTEAAFREMFAMLKPGGRLGVVDHRLPEEMDSKLEESSGYMKVSSVVSFAEKAGFRLAGSSEVNANPRDTKNHPGGVWYLPPVMRGATDDADRAARRAIGESDRMTLVFVKPAG